MGKKAPSYNVALHVAISMNITSTLSEKFILLILYIFLKLIHQATNALNEIQLLGFTLSQATKALRESRGIALLYF